MDWLTFFSSLASSLAWPSAAVIAIFLLRKEVRAQLPFLTKFKVGSLEFEFEREVKELRLEVDSELPKLPSQDVAKGRLHTLQELAKVDPRSAIIQSWVDVESQIRKLVNSLNLPTDSGKYSGAPVDIRKTSPISLLRELDKAEVISREERALLSDLRSLRNSAAHSEDFSPTYQAAMDYIDMAYRLKSALVQK